MRQAGRARLRDPHAQRYYQTKRDQGKTHRTALTAVARRRCNIILTILKTQTPTTQNNLTKRQDTPPTPGVSSA